MKWFKYIFITIGIIVITILAFRIYNAIEKEEYQSIDIYFDNIHVIKDGSDLFSVGTFYYTIKVMDRKGKILLDGNGHPAEIKISRDNYTIVDDNYTWQLAKVLRGISFSILENDVIYIEIEVMDWFKNGQDKLVGKNIITLEDPLYLFSKDWRTIDLYGYPNYQATITYRIESYKTKR